MKRNRLSLAAPAAVLTLAVAACGSSGQQGNAAAPSGEPAADQVVADGTANGIIAADPGNLDPHASNLSVTHYVDNWAYDPLVHQDANGKIISGLAERWSGSGNTYTFTLHKGVTCADGSMLSASTVADNLNYIVDPAHKSPLVGLYVPPKLKATADDQAGTVTVALAQPFPFFYTNLSQVGIVCQNGLRDRSVLAHGTAGTGPFQLSKAVPGQEYDFTRRAGYAWGPGGATTDVKGLPQQIVLKVVSSDTTTANLLQAGQANFGTVVGPDRKRLSSAGLASRESLGLLGDLWFNQDKGRPGADPRVRQALTMALDLGQLSTVMSGGTGQAPTGLVTVEPKPCTGNTVAGNLPGHDLAAAGALLDQAGWTAGADGMRVKGGQPLQLDLVYATDLGGSAGPAHELMAQQWKALGVQVKQNGGSTTQLSTALFSTGAWDVADAPVTVQVPSQFTSFASPPSPPKGTDFAHVDNAEYDRLVVSAMQKPGDEGCADWNQAEAALFKAADVVPYVNSTSPTFLKSLTLDLVAGAPVPTSLRLLKS